MSPRQRKDPEERRDDLIEAAKIVFARNGVEGTKVSQIVKEANVAQGTFYLYFKTKNDIIDALAEKTVEKMVKIIKEAIFKRNLSALEKMQIFRKTIIDMASADDDVEIGEIYHRPENQMVHYKMTERIMNQLAPLLESVIVQGSLEGSFNVADPKITAWFILGGINIMENGYHDRKELVEVLKSAFDIVDNILMGNNKLGGNNG